MKTKFIVFFTGCIILISVFFSGCGENNNAGPSDPDPAPVNTATITPAFTVTGTVSATPTATVTGTASATPTVTPRRTTVICYPANSDDGYDCSDGSTDNSEVASWIGDTSSTNVSCYIGASFDISTIPSNAVVETAEFYMYQSSHLGDPMNDLGYVVIDHVTFASIADVYDGSTVHLAGYVFLTTTNPIGMKSYTVTTRVQSDINNGRLFSQYRIRHQTNTDNDGETDGTAWILSEHETQSARPRLEITYFYY